MNIYKKDNKIVFEIEEFAKRVNPYDPDGDYGEYPTLTGLIIHHKTDGYYDEMGFAVTIDMDYKGKTDQVGDFLVSWFGEEDTFRKKCKELGIGIHEITA